MSRPLPLAVAGRHASRLYHHHHATKTWSGWVREERQRARYCTRNVEGQRMLNEWPQNMRYAKRNTYSAVPLSCLTPEPISHTIAGPGPCIRPDPWAYPSPSSWAWPSCPTTNRLTNNQLLNRYSCQSRPLIALSATSSLALGPASFLVTSTFDTEHTDALPFALQLHSTSIWGF